MIQLLLLVRWRARRRHCPSPCLRRLCRSRPRWSLGRAAQDSCRYSLSLYHSLMQPRSHAVLTAVSNPPPTYPAQPDMLERFSHVRTLVSTVCFILYLTFVVVSLESSWLALGTLILYHIQSIRLQCYRSSPQSYINHIDRQIDM